MKTGKKAIWNFGAAAFWSACLAAEVAVGLDFLMAVLARPIGLPVFAAVGAGVFAVVLLCPRRMRKTRRPVALGVLLVVALLLLVACGLWRNFSTDGVYALTDTGKAGVYGDKTVMVIVPHEDDELNVAGGVLEEYVRYGSRVYVVFVTNGDICDLGLRRIEEAIACCGSMGIAEEQVIFLGYGDQWAAGGPHLYNGETGVTLTSAVGRTETYGSDAHPAFRTGRSYTVEHFLEDMKDVILTYQPDTIICSDYDSHIDHKAVTLAFEKVMGQILREQPQYAPVVYKAFAYNTSWMAEEDFYAVNILATQNIFTEPYYQDPAIYRWEERVRLPVAADTLSRSMMTTANYRGMYNYGSQNANRRALGMTNSDKIFWQRRTDSLCYDAGVEATSGNAGLLNDFMLLECGDLVGGRAPSDGAWCPERGDTRPEVTVTFPQRRDVAQIVLYDHLSNTDNVLDAVIRFDDGTEIHTGALDADGAATAFAVNRTDVAWFTVTLLRWEGETPGLTEIEAFSTLAQGTDAFIKLTDETGNFVYDYCMDPEGVQSFRLYSYGNVPAFSEENYRVSCEGTGCQAVADGERILVTCPQGESCEVLVESRDGVFSDRVVIRNPGTARRSWMRWMQNAEATVYSVSCRTVTIRTLSWIRRHLL